MGADLSIFIGPYLKNKGHKEITEIKIDRICPNHPALKQLSAKFCSTCGTLIENVEIPEIKSFSAIDLLRTKENYGEEFVSLPYNGNILFPNTYPPKKIKFDTLDENCIDLTEIDEIKKLQIEWIKFEFINEINFLKRELGNENISIHWGILSYWS